MTPYILDVLIKATLILAVMPILSLALKHSSAAARHLLIILTFISLALIPFLSQVMPTVEVGLIPAPSRHNSLPTDAAAPPPLAELSPPPLEPTDVRIDPISPYKKLDWSLPLFFLWGAGTILLLLRLFLRLVNASRIRRHSLRLKDPPTELNLTHLGIPGNPPILMSREIHTPITIGWWRPVIILPHEALGWSGERKHSVLLHEAAHIQRRDYVSTIMAHIVTSLYWFNPLVWLTMRSLYIERERACDDFVLASGFRPSDYASHLLDIATQASFNKLLSPAGLALAKKSSLEVRLMSILEKKKKCQALKPFKGMLICLLALSFILPLASIQTWARDEVIQEEQGTVKEAVKIALEEFHQALRDQDFEKAIRFFAEGDMDDYKHAVPLAIIKEEKKQGSKWISLIKASRWKDFNVSSKIISIEETEDTVRVVEDLKIMGTDQSEKVVTLVVNPKHTLTYSLKEGSWKISHPGLKTISIQNDKLKEDRHLAICFSEEGVGLLLIRPYVEIVLKFDEKEGKKPTTHVVLTTSEGKVIKKGKKIK